MSDPVLVILAAPYSHASLVCAMLGQHPEMSALPDTNMFVADNVEAMLDKHKQIGKGVSDGLLRLLAQLHDGEKSDEAIQGARNWLDEHSRWTTRQLLDSVYQQLTPRFLVDASPANTMNEQNLKRLYSAYPDANFLHLISHPRSVAAAYLNDKRSQEKPCTWDDGSTDEEQLWLKPNTMIAEFAMSLPEGQCMRLMAEELFDDKENYLQQIAQWLDLSTDKSAITAMLHPEKMIYAKYGPPTAPCGMELDFLEQPAIPAERETVALVNSSSPSDKEFSAETLKLAREYGYQ